MPQSCKNFDTKNDKNSSAIINKFTTSQDKLRTLSHQLEKGW